MKTILFLIFLFPFNLLAVEPDEVLKDKVLEDRARMISKDLRCLVCQNENIDSSNSELAKDLRILVRERILLGYSDKEVLDFVVQRYGQYILLTPKFSGYSIFLWISGPLIFVFSIILLIVRFFNYKKKNQSTLLTHTNEDLKKLSSFLKN